MRQNFQGALSPLRPKTYSQPAVPQDVACYRILKACYLDDIMFFEGDIVTWSEEPNKEMEPLNQLAKEATNEFFDKCEKLAIEASKIKGTRYIPLRRPIEEERELNSSDKRRVELIKGDGGIPVMGARRDRAKASKVDISGGDQKPIMDLAGKKAANAVKDSGI
jgi:hypothetical protein